MKSTLFLTVNVVTKSDNDSPNCTATMILRRSTPLVECATRPFRIATGL
ncbi:MAG: hypothetical protein RIE59_05545 [Imperialibacter sp.]